MLNKYKPRGSTMITEEVKERLIADYPKFEDMTRKFYKKEMSIADYKASPVHMVAMLNVALLRA